MLTHRHLHAATHWATTKRFLSWVDSVIAGLPHRGLPIPCGYLNTAPHDEEWRYVGVVDPPSALQDCPYLRISKKNNIASTSSSPAYCNVFGNLDNPALYDDLEFETMVKHQMVAVNTIHPAGSSYFGSNTYASGID